MWDPTGTVWRGWGQWARQLGREGLFEQRTTRRLAAGQTHNVGGWFSVMAVRLLQTAVDCSRATSVLGKLGWWW